MDENEYRIKDLEYGCVYDTALKLQEQCEMAGMARQAAQAREIRRQAHQRLVALHAHREDSDEPRPLAA
jgi:hypothetical protein